MGIKDFFMVISVLALIITPIIILVVWLLKNREEIDQGLQEKREKKWNDKALSKIPEYVFEETKHINKSFNQGESIIKILQKRRAIAVLEGKNTKIESGSTILSDKTSYVFIFKTEKGIRPFYTESNIVYSSAPIISVEEPVGEYLHYTPSKFVYTGVTVGGVTTGGITDVGNYKSYKPIFSGKGVLKVFCGLDIFKARRIYLNDELYNLAKNDSYASHLLDHTNKCVNLFNSFDGMNEIELANLYNKSDRETFDILSWDNYFQKMITYDECVKFSYWFTRSLKKATPK